ncbi:3-oxoacyl-[acyl-carrier-protein] reductase [soil metagenome]
MTGSPPAPRRLEGRIAIITGAARGIGAGIARRFAREGCAVALIDRDREELSAVGRELALLGATVTLHDGDLREHAADLAFEALGQHSRIDVLVNNAGIAGSMAVDALNPERWDEMIAINLTSAFAMSRAVLGSMQEQEYGRIINIASMNGVQGFRNSSDYAVSKAGLIALTRSIAADYGRCGVTANAIAPGPIETPLSTRMLRDRPGWYVRAAVEAKPIARMGRVEDVAAAAAFFAAEESGFVTGQTLAVDGGLTACRYIPDRFSDEP